MLGIEKVNDVELLPDELYSYISDLTGRDSSFLRKELGKIQVGVDTSLETECPHCGETFKYTLPMSSTFFLA